MHPLVSDVLSGDSRALSRVCRGIDDRLPGYREILQQLYPHTGNAWVLGITGNPGAGKSTLTDRLVTELRYTHERVGVVAVDPTSPFSGGALLGDRIRMQRHFEDPGVFIRSVATRGALGGLSRSTADIARAMDAWGAGAVLIETVGVGQDELDVTRAADTTLVVVAPGLGDDIQAIKAGLLECADVFVVNKADRPGAYATVVDLQNMLALGALSLSAIQGSPGHGAAGLRGQGGAGQGGAGQGPSGEWVPPVIQTVSTEAKGIRELHAALVSHRSWSLETDRGRARRRERSRAQLVHTLRDAISEDVVERLGETIDEWVARVEAREVDPYTACDRLIDAFRH